MEYFRVSTGNDSDVFAPQTLDANVESLPFAVEPNPLKTCRTFASVGGQKL